MICYENIIEVRLLIVIDNFYSYIFPQTQALQFYLYFDLQKINKLYSYSHKPKHYNFIYTLIFKR